jgi:hypothetical protein
MVFDQCAIRVAAAVVTLGLGACQGSGGSVAGLRHSPAGVPVAFDSIDGPPPTVKTAFAGELAAAANDRQVEIAGTGASARYRVRGYLSTEPSADGNTNLAYVWDVFDAEKRRAKRITGSSSLQKAAAEPWSGLDKDTLRRLAAMSMDEIAGFLSETPAVVAAAAE